MFEHKSHRILYREKRHLRKINYVMKISCKTINHAILYSISCLSFFYRCYVARSYCEEVILSIISFVIKVIRIPPQGVSSVQLIILFPNDSPLGPDYRTFIYSHTTSQRFEMVTYRLSASREFLSFEFQWGWAIAQGGASTKA